MDVFPSRGISEYLVTGLVGQKNLKFFFNAPKSAQLPKGGLKELNQFYPKLQNMGAFFLHFSSKNTQSDRKLDAIQIISLYIYFLRCVSHCGQHYI